MSTGNELVTLKQANMYYKDLRGQSAPVIFNSVVGNPAVFSDGADGLPIQSLKVHLLPRQEGTGDASPENVRNFIPWNGLTVNQCGKNLFNESQLLVDGISLVDGYYIGTRQAFYVAFGRNGNKFALPPFKPNTQYTLTATGKNNTDSGGSWIVIHYTDNSTSSWIKIEGTEEQTKMVTTNSGKTISYIDFTYPSGGDAVLSIKEIMFEEGTISSAYEPYNPITETEVALSSAIYGGIPDLISGTIMVTHVCLDLHKSDFTQVGTNGVMPYRQTPISFIIQHRPKSRVDWEAARQQQKINCAVIANPYSETAYGEYIGVCLWDTAVPTTVRISQSVYDALGENDIVSICYEIDDPFPVQLTPTQLQSLYGTNTIWSDANGDIEVEYRADTGLFLKQNTVKDVQLNGSSILTDGVVNVPVATRNTAGVAKCGSGLEMYEDALTVAMATSPAIKGGTASSFLRPVKQHESVFYGLAKAAGADMASSSNPVGQFTDEAKIAIQKMFGIPNMKSELIFSTIVAEDTSKVTINVDNNGNTFKLRAFKLEVLLSESTTGNRDYTTVRGKFTLMDEIGSKLTKSFPTLYMYAASGGLNTYECEMFDGMWYSRAFAAKQYGSSSSSFMSMNHDLLAKYIDQLEIMQYSDTSTLIPAGTVIKLYGIRYIE